MWLWAASSLPHGAGSDTQGCFDRVLLQGAVDEEVLARKGDDAQLHKPGKKPSNKKLKWADELMEGSGATIQWDENGKSYDYRSRDEAHPLGTFSHTYPKDQYERRGNFYSDTIDSGFGANRLTLLDLEQEFEQLFKAEFEELLALEQLSEAHLAHISQSLRYISTVKRILQGEHDLGLTGLLFGLDDEEDKDAIQDEFDTFWETLEGFERRLAEKLAAGRACRAEALPSEGMQVSQAKRRRILDEQSDDKTGGDN